MSGDPQWFGNTFATHPDARELGRVWRECAWWRWRAAGATGLWEGCEVAEADARAIVERVVLTWWSARSAEQA